MQRPELVKKILDYIKILYKADYVGLLEVDQLEDEYTCTIGIPSYMSPTTISTQAADDESFLEFLFEELRVRNYVRTEIYKVIRTNEKREEK